MDAGTGVETVSDVRDLSLADQGKRRMEWTFQQMPVLQAIRGDLCHVSALFWFGTGTVKDS